MPNVPQLERRIPKDRRANPTAPFTSESFFGQRRNNRRDDDGAENFYVDRYSLRSVSIVLFIISLSVCDAIFTLHLINHGAEEVNPVMDFFLQIGPTPFLFVKYFLTGGSLLLFLIHKNFTVFGGRVRVKAILVTFLIFYTALIIYELILISQI